MTEPPREPRVQRQRLGAELRRLRMLAGLSGREVGRRSGISHPNISRIENGQIVPSLPQVRAWASAVDLDAGDLTRLTSMTEAALNEVTTYRARLRAGLSVFQADVQDLESTTRVMRTFQTATVPGLLQTADYAWHVLSLASQGPRTEIAEAVAVRLRRQSVIADPARQFEWIMTESAVRWRPDGMQPEVHSAQIDRIIAVASLENVTIGVIPHDATLKTIIWCGFDLFDERDLGYPPFVVVETPHAAVYASDPADIEFYRDHLSAIREAAVFGDEAIAVIQTIAGS
jgi:transcriptional regulator with XRE-family HTH domain